MTRIACPNCNSSTALGHTHCFKCGHINSSVKFTDQFLSDINTIKKRKALTVRSDIVLAPNKFSINALRWLYKYNIFDTTILDQSIAYCKNIDKVFVPAFDGEYNLKFYHLRSLSVKVPHNTSDDRDRVCTANPSGVDTTIKYITCGQSSQYTINYNDHDGVRTVCICEDHLSAIRLRKFINVVCLSGTSLNNETIYNIISRYDRIIFWLDPDQPGQSATIKNLKRIRWRIFTESKKRMMLGQDPLDIEFYKINHRVIEEDPKFYYNHEIKNILIDELVNI